MPPATSTAVAPSTRPGMGTILFSGGVAFRVWAPFASSVFAAGTFNAWSTSANPFASEGNGYWSVEVPGAGIGDEYQFVITNGDQPLIWHKNPYASEVVTSSGNAIIRDSDFDWTGDNFTMPAWNELVIYEMHVGSFNDAPGSGPGTFAEIVPKLPYLADLESTPLKSCRWRNLPEIIRGATIPRSRLRLNTNWADRKDCISLSRRRTRRASRSSSTWSITIAALATWICGYSMAGRMRTTTAESIFTTISAPKLPGAVPP